MQGPAVARPPAVSLKARAAWQIRCFSCNYNAFSSPSQESIPLGRTEDRDKNDDDDGGDDDALARVVEEC
jgi:hypothetical protein